jgi:hypothetical protein
MGIEIPPPTRSELLTIVSTEHFTLQGARSAAISDANGRTGFFLATLSAVVVALAFVAQISAFGEAFVLFAIVLLPMLLFIGLAIFERLLQLAIENIRCVVAINRLRHYYLEIAPELGPHLTLSPHDDAQGVLVSLGAPRTRLRRWDLLISNAGLVALIDAMVGAVIAGLVAWLLGLGMTISIVAAGLCGIALAVLLLAYLARTWRMAWRVIGVRFASGSEVLATHDGPPSAA